MYGWVLAVGAALIGLCMEGVRRQVRRITLGRWKRLRIGIGCTGKGARGNEVA